MSNPPDDLTITISVTGHVDDLYMLSLLFPLGALPDLHVVSEITGEKKGPFDRATNAEKKTTFVTGRGCEPVMHAPNTVDGFWIAQDILAPLNGYAALIDSSFTPVEATGASWNSTSGDGGMTFGSSIPNRPTRHILARHHPKVQELLPSRVSFMREDELAAHAAEVIGSIPSWTDYYRLLEDIAGELRTSLARLDRSGLAKPEALEAFKRAANNRTAGRHGAAGRKIVLGESEMMNLLEAREFVRGVVSNWLDLKCGDFLPRDRVNGGSLRFGLDDDQ